MSEQLRINFVLPPSPKISGGPLAILEYANRLLERGHLVTITTYPNSFWDGENPFPWFDFKGAIHYKRDRSPLSATGSRLAGLKAWTRRKDVVPQRLIQLYRRLLGSAAADASRLSSSAFIHRAPLEWMINETAVWTGLIEVMPDCDLNIATLWSTAFPVYFSRKGKPVYFMQHYEEIFYTMEPDFMLHRLAARMSYFLPVYKVANSSWLQRVILEKTGQHVPFSNNGLEISDFTPRRKWSEADGILRIVTFSRPEQWKGFADAASAISRVMRAAPCAVEWNVFGYLHNEIAPDNEIAPYKYHPKLSFHDLAELYASCDIAVCPSWYESFPLPPLEAMASGTAVVTTSLGTEDYAFDGSNALVIEPRDIEAMFNAIMRLIGDPELRAQLGSAGRATAERFDWNRAVAVREALLLQIHRGDVAYDVMASAQSGLCDFQGRSFDIAGVSDLPEMALVSRGGMVFLLVHGVFHHVLNVDLLKQLEDAGVLWTELPMLVSASIPRGMAIVSRSDFSTLLRKR